jgi:hypothetical protein
MNKIRFMRVSSVTDHIGTRTEAILDIPLILNQEYPFRMTAIEETHGSTRIPWYIWVAAMAVTSAMIGIQWDISWHRSIGRDTFLTPAHIAIYMCGVLAGITCGYLILATTFTNARLREASVKVWGFRAPLGAFVAAWGGCVMLISAPFDDWWHSAYGLDVKILSPPHVVLAIGINAIGVGVLLLVAGERNRTLETQRGPLNKLLLYAAAMLLLAAMAVSMEYSFMPMQHSAIFYDAVCVTVPFLLTLASTASGSRWGATFVAGVYTVFTAGLIWILPLFPATPKLGPVYRQVTHFVPPNFPLLIIVPAIALDLFWSRVPEWGAWKKAVVSAVLFLAVFFAVQWPFSAFLQTPASQNAIFGTGYLDYLSPPNSLVARHAFAVIEKTPREFWTGMAFALLWATIGIRIGLARGTWIRGLQR